MRSILDVNPLQLSTSRKVAHMITSRDPIESLRDMGDPTPHELRQRFNEHIRNDYNLTSDEIQLSAGLLTQGLDATRKIVLNILDQPNLELDIEKKIEIARHDETVGVMAVVALHDTFGARELMEVSSYKYRHASPFHINRQGNSIVFKKGFSPVLTAENGCPAAMTRRNKIISPLFSRFVKWSGEVAVRSSYADTSTS
jgi:hypothetical protein